MIDLRFNLVDSLLWLLWCPCFVVHFGGLAQAGREGCDWQMPRGDMFKNASICHTFSKWISFREIIIDHGFPCCLFAIQRRHGKMTDDQQAMCYHTMTHTALHSACCMDHTAFF